MLKFIAPSERYHKSYKVKEAVRYWSQEILLPLCKSLTRLHSEYASPVLSSYHKNDIILFEKGESHFTQMSSDIASKPHEEFLSILKLTTLKTRKIRADLLELFRMFPSFSQNILTVFFMMTVSDREGHKFRIC